MHHFRPSAWSNRLFPTYEYWMIWRNGPIDRLKSSHMVSGSILLTQFRPFYIHTTFSPNISWSSTGVYARSFPQVVTHSKCRISTTQTSTNTSWVWNFNNLSSNFYISSQNPLKTSTVSPPKNLPLWQSGEPRTSILHICQVYKPPGTHSQKNSN